ncbi:MAG: hypothetical protein HYX48_04610 [Chlamydiales bacterium]|nr:hypothetical protein [Chlamydiales bacterium]
MSAAAPIGGGPRLERKQGVQEPAAQGSRPGQTHISTLKPHEKAPAPADEGDCLSSLLSLLSSSWTCIEDLFEWILSLFSQAEKPMPPPQLELSPLLASAENLYRGWLSAKNLPQGSLSTLVTEWQVALKNLPAVVLKAGVAQFYAESGKIREDKKLTEDQLLEKIKGDFSNREFLKGVGRWIDIQKAEAAKATIDAFFERWFSNPQTTGTKDEWARDLDALVALKIKKLSSLLKDSCRTLVERRTRIKGSLEEAYGRLKEAPADPRARAAIQQWRAHHLCELHWHATVQSEKSVEQQVFERWNGKTLTKSDDEKALWKREYEMLPSPARQQGFAAFCSSLDGAWSALSSEQIFLFIRDRAKELFKPLVLHINCLTMTSLNVSMKDDETILQSIRERPQDFHAQLLKWIDSQLRTGKLKEFGNYFSMEQTGELIQNSPGNPAFLRGIAGIAQPAPTLASITDDAAGWDND